MRYHTAAIIGALVKIVKEPKYLDPEKKTGSVTITQKLRLEFEKTTKSKLKSDSGYYTLEFVINYGSLLNSKMEYCEIERPIFKDRCRALRFTKIDIKKDRSGDIYFTHSDCGEQSIELRLGNTREFSGIYSLSNGSGEFTGDFYEREEKGFFVPEIHIRDKGPSSKKEADFAQMVVKIKDFEPKSLSTT